jgi:hypothetical protein
VLTTPLEKVMYHVLRATYEALETPGWSQVSAWADINPQLGFRAGDTDEIVEAKGVRLIDPDRLGNGAGSV